MQKGSSWRLSRLVAGMMGYGEVEFKRIGRTKRAVSRREKGNNICMIAVRHSTSRVSHCSELTDAST